MRVLVIHGSLRRDAFTTRLSRAAAGLAQEGLELDLYDGLEGIPGFNQDLEPDVPATVEDLRKHLDSADALLVVTPEYNASAPGALKNAIDWASRPHGESALAGKPAAIISASPMPFGGIWANQQIRKAFTITGTPTVEREVAIGKIDEKLAEDDSLNDSATQELVKTLLLELEELVGEVNQGAEEEAAAA